MGYLDKVSVSRERREDSALLRTAQTEKEMELEMSSDNLERRVRGALRMDMVVDITTTGRRTGQPRRIEIWAHNLDGRLFLTASPGRRSWYANMLNTPEIILHLKDDVKADLTASV